MASFLADSAIKTTTFHVASNPLNYFKILRHGPDLTHALTPQGPALWTAQKPWFTFGPMVLEVAIKAHNPHIGAGAASHSRSIQRLLGTTHVTPTGPDATFIAANREATIREGSKMLGNGSNLSVIAQPGSDVRVVLSAKTLAAPLLAAATGAGLVASITRVAAN